jgi:5-methylcytosine-specific restriction endonuclease McrA
MLPRELAVKVFIRDGWKCVNPSCRSRENLTPHHIKYKSKGGPDSPENLVTLCIFCHNSLHDGKLKIDKIEPSVYNTLGLKFIRIGN